MFEGTQNPQSAPGQTSSMNAAQGAPLSTPKQVYTMPEKFMQPRKVSKGKPKKWLIIVGICGAVLLIFIAIIVYAFQAASQNSGVGNENINTVANTNLVIRNGNQNSNSNVNSNANENTNSGASLNLNVNGDIGANINSGLFPNGNSNGNSNTNSAIPLPDRSNVSDGRDKDRDGLTDVEEEIYTTRFDQPDTDKDGYVDGTEVRNSFSPVEAGKSLLQGGLVIAYAQPDFGWTIQYPADWIAEPVNDTHTEVLFTSDSVDGEFVEVLFTENANHQTAAEWYASLYEDVDPSDLEAVTVDSLQGIVSPDGFAYYLADESYIIGIIYNFGTKDQIQFRTTFEMMVNTFAYTAVEPAATNTNGATNQNGNANGNSNVNVNSNTNSNQSSNANGNSNTNT